MIKKKLGLLAGAVMLASGANAAIDAGDQNFGANGCAYDCWAGTDSDVVLFLHDSTDANGSFFVNLTALDATVTVDSLLAGAAPNVDIASTGVSVGNYDSWGIFATSNDLETSYYYARAGINLGVLTTDSDGLAGAVGGAEASTDAQRLTNDAWIGQINTALGGADFGAVGTADAADFNNDLGRPTNPGTELTAIGSTANLYFYGIQDLTPEGNYLAPIGANIDTTADYTQLVAGVNITGTVVSAVPVPAAAWLFGSA